MSFRKELFVSNIVLLIIVLCAHEFTAKSISNCEDMGKDEIVRELDIFLLGLILICTQIRKNIITSKLYLSFETALN